MTDLTEPNLVIARAMPGWIARDAVAATKNREGAPAIVFRGSLSAGLYARHPLHLDALAEVMRHVQADPDLKERYIDSTIDCCIGHSWPKDWLGVFTEWLWTTPEGNERLTHILAEVLRDE